MIGSVLNQYRLDEVVGEGGMGVVYRALDMNLERTVAVKVLNASFRDDPEFVARFRQEARIQAGLNHPNIATLFDFFVWDDTPVAVMEFIEGESLRSLVDRSGPIPAHIALPILVQALRGVAAGHKRGIIHRDLKPSNIMITGEGTVKITDFGIAKVRSNTSLTRVSTRVGSPSYMAPEQIMGRPVDERTDIYVMGGTLYELLTGRPPFQGLSQFEIDSAHVRDLPKLPTEYYADIPSSAVDAVMRALAKDPAERFATAEEFIRALPDLGGAPYVAVVNDDDATRRSQPIASKVADAVPARTVSAGVTLLQPNAVEVEATQLQQDRPKSQNARRAAITVAISGVLVFAIIGILILLARQGRINPDQPNNQNNRNNPDHRIEPAHPSKPSSNTAVNSQPGTRITPLAAANSRPLEPSSPTSDRAHDLTGKWTGTYVNRSGTELLQLLNLQLQQAPNGDITGRFSFRMTGSADEECTLEKSTYSTQSRRLRLITHCRNPNHPKYLNVPLEFNNVDPGATTIKGGQLAFHLADDVVVTLDR